MHLLATTSTSLDEIVEAVDLGQPPGEIVVLSFADSDLASLAVAWEAERTVLPSVRLHFARPVATSNASTVFEPTTANALEPSTAGRPGVEFTVVCQRSAPLAASRATMRPAEP